MGLSLPYVVAHPRDSSLSLWWAPSLAAKSLIFIYASNYEADH
ncbi:MAG: hypothetical protein ACXU7H_12085 [Burkholderiaceae bacterium]